MSPAASGTSGARSATGSPGRRRAARWLVVLVLLAVVAAAPEVVGRIERRPPAGSGDVTAATVLARVQAARHLGWSGYAESRGGLALPVTTVFPALVDLAGSTTTTRSWWRGDTSWRVDQLSTVGETDTVRDADGAWSWDFQADSATRTRLPADARVRLPEASDLLPPNLAGRLLSEALPSEASRLPAQRIAGHEALGLRVVPAQPQASVDRVDVWADTATGLPLRVDVYGAGSSVPAMASSFLDVEVATPDVARVQFSPPPGAKVSFHDDADGSDIASAVDRFSRVQPPGSLAGLPRSTRTPGLGAVGVYGRGVTELVAVPLLTRYAGSLRTQLAAAGTATTDADGAVALAAGPISLLVTAPDEVGRFWLLTGTVTPTTLTTAAAELPGDRRAA